ncbi:MAG TPA: isoprenylcysteine carboxylmethyltransferase family protein [Terriglobales bacterium]|nr:isoprenylcysteine carboxylmethyltransferase family protein [Terriglobales bacterium]
MALHWALDCWMALGAYWLVTWTRVKATVEREGVSEWMRHRAPLAAAYVLLLDSELDRIHLSLGALPAPEWLRAMGVAITMAGLALAIGARRTLGGNWSATVTLKQGHTLTTNGPYRWVRNPIYTGILSMIVGTALVEGRGRGWLALMLAIAAFLVKIQQEERFMQRQFPQDFPAYRRRTAALVPLLY